jgi:hypothetical protein
LSTSLRRRGSIIFCWIIETPRAGDFASLRFVKDKGVVLARVSAIV